MRRKRSETNWGLPTDQEGIFKKSMRIQFWLALIIPCALIPIVLLFVMFR